MCIDGSVDAKSKFFHYLKYFYTTHGIFGLLSIYILHSGNHSFRASNALIALSLFLCSVSTFGVLKLLIDSIYMPICCFNELHHNFKTELFVHFLYYASDSLGAISLYFYMDSSNSIYLGLAWIFGILFFGLWAILTVNNWMKMEESITKNNSAKFIFYSILTYCFLSMILLVVFGYFVRREELLIISIVLIIFSGGFMVGGALFSRISTPGTISRQVQVVEGVPTHLEGSTATVQRIEPSTPPLTNESSRTADIEMTERLASTGQPRREVAGISQDQLEERQGLST